MGRHTIFVMVALTFVWIILMESVSWQNVAIGMFMSMLCAHLIGKFLNFEEISSVNFYKLIGYPLWLVGRIYMDALFLVKMILTDAKWGITTYKLELTNESLRIMLADSITLTPGSIYLGIEEKDITLLCIGSKKKKGYPTAEDDLRSIERILLKSQKQDSV
ncbi:MAG: Na+/H+ antiporter subunit E [Defluviitaleaceae bacterium]|nr:Na+/H+ antiporter subunit E [Defluviitaleaceae bacterium]